MSDVNKYNFMKMKNKCGIYAETLIQQYSICNITMFIRYSAYYFNRVLFFLQ